MKMLRIKSPVLVGLCALCMACAPIKSELKDISQTHLGFYECENATLSGDGLMDKFDYVRLELKADETFVLFYRKTGEKEKKQFGTYSYDREKGEICLGKGENNAFKRTFPLQDGVMHVTVRLGGKTLQMQFKQK